MSTRKRRLAAIVTMVMAVTAGCGGGGGAENTPSPPVDTSTSYAHSQVLGRPGAQVASYVPASGAVAAQLRVAGSSTALTAEYLPTTLAGVRVACVSGNGSSIGVLRDLNPGVLSVSAAVLLDARWQDVADTDAAFASAAARGETWKGWENCGVKPEGAPSPSSSLKPAADGGYAEDIYVGNPGTNFMTIRLPVAPADAAAMRATNGFATREDPSRPLLITWRAFNDGAGHTIWVERGEAAAGAPAGTQGFLTLFVPES